MLEVTWYLLFNVYSLVSNKGQSKPSRGGLEVEAWTDNSLHSASVGSNPV